VPPKCTICCHKKRCAIDQYIVDGETSRNIAKQFKVGYSSVERHIKAGHVSEPIKAAEREKLIKQGKTLHERLRDAQDICLEAALQAKADDLRAFGGCMAAMMKGLDIEAKITIPENRNVNLTITDGTDIDARLELLAERRKARRDPTNS
jgi:hypothetical protein